MPVVAKSREWPEGHGPVLGCPMPCRTVEAQGRVRPVVANMISQMKDVPKKEKLSTKCLLKWL